MVAFLKSDLFLRFLGGFVLGTIGVVALHSAEPVAMASTAQPAPVYVDATL
jgi:hypothetical protein